MSVPMRPCRVVDLDSVPGLGDAMRADYVLLCGEVAVVVEETGRAEPRDVEKVVRTIDAVRRGAIPGATASKVIGVVHGTSIDSMVSRVCRQHRVMTAGCRGDLDAKIRRVLRIASRRR